MTMVCEVDGVEVVESRSGRLVHIDELPRGTDPDHEILIGEVGAWRAKQEREGSIRSAIDDMLQHHSSLCPWSSCEFTVRLAAAADRLKA